MSRLSAPRRRTLELVCETFMPALEPQDGDDAALFACHAGQLQLADEVEAAAWRIGGERALGQLARFLGLLEQPVVNGLMAGRWRRFSRLELDDRAHVLRAWRESRFTEARRVFSALKRITLLHCYAGKSAEGVNAAWSSLGYPAGGAIGTDGSLTTSATDEGGSLTTSATKLAPLAIHGPQTMTADVLIVGSGAGGGVVAAELAAAGFDVLLAEKGRCFQDHEFPADELTGLRELYEGHGSLTTADGATVVLAGSTMGGGTTVNWMTCLKPPEAVREQWRDEFGFAAGCNGELEHSLDVVWRRLGVTTAESPLNVQNDLLERGCRALGYETSVIPRNVRGCRDCDFCGYGCRHGAKQDTRQTFLADAVAHGARLLARAQCDRLLHDCKAVRGALLTVETTQGQAVSVEVHAKIVVLAAGAIHTPAVLLRSGIRNPHVGRNLHLHPTTAAYARYEQPVRSWRGVPQSRVCEHFADLDGQGHGVRLEVAPAHPGLWGMALPWDSPRSHRRQMQQLPHLGNVIVLTRDRHGGRVRIDGQGRPVIDYSVHRDDARHMSRGVVEALRIQRAAGALEVFSPHHHDYACGCGDEQALEAWLQRVARQPIVKHSFGLFSAHQMSSCRLAGRREQGAVRPDGESWDVANLYVADASLMPTACGVNPMITIMGLAHHVAQHVKLRLG